MHKYAQIQENKVVNVIIADDVFVSAHPDNTYVLIDKVDPEPGIGWGFQNEQFTAPVVDNSYMLFESENTTVQIGEAITITATIGPDKGNTDVNGKFFVPVIRTSDNKQGAFLMFEFVDGEASTSLEISDPGHYILDINKITPKPVSKVASNITDIIIY